MNIYALIFCFFSVGIGTTYCMQQELPKRFRDLDWQADVRALTKQSTAISKKEYKETLDQILEYAVDEYERKKGIKLLQKNRKVVKVKLYRNALGYSLSLSQ